MVDAIGPWLVAFIAGIHSTVEPRGWITGELTPEHEQRLRYALQAAKILLREGPEVAAAWFGGENHHFNGNSPALVLRDGPPEAGADVVLAALAFVEA